MTERELQEIEKRLRAIAVFRPDDAWRIDADQAGEMLNHAQMLVAEVRRLRGLVEIAFEEGFSYGIDVDVMTHDQAWDNSKSKAHLGE